MHKIRWDTMIHGRYDGRVRAEDPTVTLSTGSKKVYLLGGRNPQLPLPADQ
jgi:hypothetical protein